MGPELSEGVFSLGKQPEKRKAGYKSRQGASLFFSGWAAGVEEEG